MKNSTVAIIAMFMLSLILSALSIGYSTIKNTKATNNNEKAILDLIKAMIPALIIIISIILLFNLSAIILLIIFIIPFRRNVFDEEAMVDEPN